MITAALNPVAHPFTDEALPCRQLAPRLTVNTSHPTRRLILCSPGGSMTLFRRFRTWLLESEIDAELRFHLDSYAHDLISQGISREEALRRARLEFGGLAVVYCRRSR